MSTRYEHTGTRSEQVSRQVRQRRGQRLTKRVDSGGRVRVEDVSARMIDDGEVLRALMAWSGSRWRDPSGRFGA